MRRSQLVVLVSVVLFGLGLLLWLTRSERARDVPAVLEAPRPSIGTRAERAREMVSERPDASAPRDDALASSHVLVVTRCRGERIAGAVVTMTGDGPQVDAITDENGVAVFDLGAGAWTMAVAVEAFGPPSDLPAIHVASGRPLEFEVELEPLFPLDGTVVDEAGIPLAEVQVNDALSNDAGVFHARVSQARGMAWLRARHPAYVSAGDWYAFDAGAVRIVLRRRGDAGVPGEVSGMVVEFDGQPYSRAGALQVTCEGPQGGEDTTSVVEARFTLRCPPNARLFAFGAESTAPVEVAPGQFIELRLAPVRHVSGRAIDDTGAALSRVRVKRRSLLLGDVVTADGTFVFDALEPELVELSFSTPTISGFVTRTVDLRSADVDLGDLVFARAATRRGVVVDEEGSPIAGARVEGGGVDVRTDEKGRFEYQGDANQRFELTVTRDGFRARQVPIIASPSDLRIELTRRSSSSAIPEFAGIGMAMGETVDGGYPIIAVFPATPALEAGLKVGDVVTGVDGVPALEGPINDLLLRIRGPEGTVVRLSLRRDGRNFDVRITRRRITSL